MTIVMHKAQPNTAAPWSSMPGWGIVVDLTPPELQERRALAVLRRVIAVSLVLVLMICVAGYVLASRSVDSAKRTLASTTSKTAQIQTKLDRHSGVTQVRSATTAIDSQLSTLFATDVDVPKLVQDVTQALPNDMVITSVNVSVTAGAASTGLVAGSAGTVTLAGTSEALDDLAHYVSALNGLDGVAMVLPTTDAAANNAVSWTLSLQLTTARYTHRFGSASPTPATEVPASEAPTADDTTGGN